MEAWEREKTWQQAAIATAIIAAVGFVATAILVLQAGDNRERIEIVTIAAPFGVFLGAAVTFCTVLWRGLVSMRQTQVAQEQLASTDENNLAHLLQKAAELLADADKEGHVAAGIASLQSVVTAKNPKFAKEAMELIADYVAKHFQSTHSHPLCLAALNVMDAGANRGFEADREVSFKAPDDRRSSWRLMRGTKWVSYTGGAFWDFQNREVKRINAENYYFEDVIFRGEYEIEISDNAEKCSFQGCKIVKFGTFFVVDEGNRFSRCDFSGCETDKLWKKENNEFEHCIFYEDDPPVGEESKYLLANLKSVPRPEKGGRR